ncbi:similar to An02g00920 [Aspergillus niger]|uniref:Similar to An02g00920 n=1 Tax=Aspergillus niger TaxID=5061 RepID=A0A124BV69_ASPNG|nr:similar to An02g00920 [Aspergillus niger]
MSTTSEKNTMGIAVEEVRKTEPELGGQNHSSPSLEDLIEEVPPVEDSPSLIETIGYLLSIQDGYGPPDSTWDVEDFD